jgi:two-component system, LytTR family, response regulator
MELKFHRKISSHSLAILLVSGGFLFTLVKDFSQTVFTNSAYYFSESFLFSSFWWWFIPFCILQNRILQKEALHFKQQVLLYLFFIGAHLFVSAVWIDLISTIFYEQRFIFWKGMGFSFAENGYSLLLLYALPFFFKSAKTQQAVIEPSEPINKVPLYSPHLLVQEGHQKILVTKQEIQHIQSSPPYVVIYTPAKKYLHKTTLGKIQEELPSDQFVRIHKSTIVNTQQIASFRSRQNGDYDIVLKDQTLLRLSRNYASDFKRVMGTNTQDTTI